MSIKMTAKKLLRQLKSGILRMFSANVINKIIGMLSTMILTRILTKDEYGVWGYALNIYSYLIIASGFGLTSGALQFGTENHGSPKAYNYFKYCINRGTLINLLLVMAVMFFTAFASLPISNAKPIVIFLLPIVILDYIISIGQVILRSQNRINDYANILNINTVLNMVCTCVGALFGVVGVLTGKYICTILSMYIEYRILKKDISSIINADMLSKKETGDLWHYSVFTGISSAMNVVVYSLDVTLIGGIIKSASQIASYKVATLVPNALQFIPVSVVVSVLPSVIYNKNNAAWIKNYLKKLYLGMFICNTIICAGVFIFAPLIIRIFSGDGYEESVSVLRVLTLGYFFSGTFRNLSANILAAFKRVRFNLFISIMTCVFDLLFNILLINKYGMIGAAYATLLVDILAAVLSFGYMVYIIMRGQINETD